MDPSVCRLHPGVAVTGFCPACLRDRLAGLQPPSAADLRRCKSFSYARSAAAAAAHSHFEPQRRSCDLFRQEPIAVPVPVPEEEEEAVQLQRRTEPSRKSFGGLLGKKLQQWRRKTKPAKKEEEPMPMPEIMPGRHRQHSFRDDDGGRRYCDQLDPMSFSLFGQLPPAMEAEEMPPPDVPRSDGQIPVEEEDLFYPNYYDNAVPGGCAQTRDYYFDSSSSSRRRRSVDRSTASGRNSFSDANVDRITTNNNANARVSPAIAAAEFYQAQSSILVHHHHQSYTGSFGSASFRDHHHTNNKQGGANNKPAKKGIKGWSIWGLINKKSSSSSRKPAEAEHGSFSVSAGVGDEVEYPWPELRARGYNGQMLRCNSSISARSSFSGGAAAMIGGSGSARRSISGMDMHDVMNGHGSGRTRRDEILLERNLSTRSRSGHDHPMGAANLSNNYQFSRPNHNGVPKGRSSKSSLPRRSTLGLYSTDPIPRH